MVLMPVPNPKNTTTMPVMTPITCRQKKTAQAITIQASDDAGHLFAVST